MTMLWGVQLLPSTSIASPPLLDSLRTLLFLEAQIQLWKVTSPNLAPCLLLQETEAKGACLVAQADGLLCIPELCLLHVNK